MFENNTNYFLWYGALAQFSPALFVAVTSVDSWFKERGKQSLPLANDTFLSFLHSVVKEETTDNEQEKRDERETQEVEAVSRRVLIWFVLQTCWWVGEETDLPVNSSPQQKVTIQIKTTIICG